MGASPAKCGRSRWEALLAFMHAVSLRHDSIVTVAPTFHFQVVTTDPDDNKFRDCAIVANADWRITEEARFAPLAEAGGNEWRVIP